MENNNEQKDDGFTIKVYGSGNFIAKDMKFEGPINIGTGSDNTNHQSYTDEQIARAIEAIAGKDKPLNSKQLWGAVYWCLRWYCNFPVKGSEFCERVEKLPFSGKIEPECELDNFRKFLNLSFMNQNCRELDDIKPSKMDKTVFTQYRTVVIALVEELQKTSTFRPLIK